jgi:hypothetical protein
MEVIETLGEDDMIFAWVEAERESPRHRAPFEAAGIGSVPLSPDTRRTLLAATRGFPDRFVFNGLPLPMDWNLVRLTIEELGGWRYLNYGPTFVALSEGSRLVRDGAANLERMQVGEELNERVAQTEAGLAAGQVHEPLIAVTSPKEPTPILIEGNTRATTYLRVLRPEEEIELILGTATDLSSWQFV